MRRRGIIAMVVGLAMSPAVGLAQEKPADSPKALQSEDLSADERQEVGRLLLEAKRAYASKDYDLALARLESAFAIFPDINVQRRIGETLERLRRDREALETYRALLERDGLDAAGRDAVQRRVSFLEDLLIKRRATVRVTSNLDGTRIFVGGEAEPRGAAPVELELDPGDYVLRAENEERGRTLEVSLSEKEVVDWDVQWVVEPMVVIEDRSTEKATDGATDRSSSPLGWIMVGVGIAGLAGSATTAVLASQAGSTLDDYDQERSDRRPADYASVESRHNNLVLASLIAAGIGTVATSVGLYFLFTSPGDDEPGWGIAPTDGGAQVQMGWRW